jgi:hypothetical protein
MKEETKNLISLLTSRVKESRVLGIELVKQFAANGTRSQKNSVWANDIQFILKVAKCITNDYSVSTIHEFLLDNKLRFLKAVKHFAWHFAARYIDYEQKFFHHLDTKHYFKIWQELNDISKSWLILDYTYKIQDNPFKSVLKGYPPNYVMAWIKSKVDEGFPLSLPPIFFNKCYPEAPLVKKVKFVSQWFVFNENKNRYNTSLPSSSVDIFVRTLGSLKVQINFTVLEAGGLVRKQEYLSHRSIFALELPHKRHYIISKYASLDYLNTMVNNFNMPMPYPDTDSPELLENFLKHLSNTLSSVIKINKTNYALI